ncbi:MAG: D-alanyl-D-alanine carboxypeptidase [Clostridia bacterium]|nr:D-alanyl-D-alanine carboxypeptidase [Clostridia bacterium]
MRCAKILFSLILIVTVVFRCACTVDALDIGAKSYVLLNADTFEVIDSSDAHLRLPIASTTKLMTALILAEQEDLNTEIVTTAEMVTVEGSSMGLKVGDTVSYYELLVGMLLPSGNDAANTTAIVLAGSLEKFADVMNLKASELGMTNSHFVTPSGLDAKGHYSTAYDMAILSAHVLKNKVIREIVSKEKITLTFGNPPYERTLYNHNKLLTRYEYCIGVKTGYTKKSGRCLVSAAQKDGCTVIAVTLNDSDDWNDHEKLLTYGLSLLESVNADENISLPNISVVGGSCDNVSLLVPDFTCGVLQNSGSYLSHKLELPPFLYAPIDDGTSVGEISYYYNDVLIKKDPIKAAKGCIQSHTKQRPFELFYNYFIGLLNCLI